MRRWRAWRPGRRRAALGLGSPPPSFGCAGRARPGERTARLQGQPRRSKLDPHRDFLLGLIEAKDDISLVEMQERLAAERGIRASVGTIWTVLDRCNMTVKKRPLMRPSRTGLMC